MKSIAGKITVFLLVLFLIYGLVACSGGSDTSGGLTTAPATAQVQSTSSDSMANYHAATSGKTPVDFNGATVTFLTGNFADNGWTQWNERDIVSAAGKETGDPINDAVYKRNLQIQQDFNCTIAMIEDMSSGNSQYESDVKKMVQAGTQDFQATLGYMAYSHADWTNGLYLNLYNISSMDLSAPYYIQNSVTGLSIAHYLPVVQSDMQLKPYEALNAMIFNKQLVQDYNMPDLYNLVATGQWTLDELQTLASSAYKDLNGDGVMTFEDDQFGLITQGDTLVSFFHGAGCMFATKDPSTDIPSLSFDTPKTYDVLKKTTDMMFANYSVELHLFNAQYADIYNEQVKVFEENQAVFSWVRMILVEELRGMDTDFGILPIPKYDTNQTNYICEVNPYTANAIGIPRTVSNPEQVGALVDAMSALSLDWLVPAYYNVNLQGKLLRDDQSRAMLDIIFSNPLYDSGEIYDFGGLNTMVSATGGSTKVPDFASSYAKIATKAQKDMDKIVGAFTDLLNQQ